MSTPMICRRALKLRTCVASHGGPARCQPARVMAARAAPCSAPAVPRRRSAEAPAASAHFMASDGSSLRPVGRSKTDAVCRAAAPGVPELAAATVSTSGVGHVLAVVVGYLVILGSLTVKVPQIVRILKKESTDGLSVVGHVAETLAYTIMFAYNMRNAYPFSSYGDVVSCWIQNLVIAALIAKYRQYSALQVGVGALVTVGFCYFLATPSLCGPATLAALQASTLAVLVLGARLPQIWLNHKRGNTGELSMITYGLQLAGNLARVFTSLMLTGDMLLIGFAGTVSACNFVILMQTYATWRRDRAKAQTLQTDS